MKGWNDVVYLHYALPLRLSALCSADNVLSCAGSFRVTIWACEWQKKEALLVDATLTVVLQQRSQLRWSTGSKRLVNRNHLHTKMCKHKVHNTGISLIILVSMVSVWFSVGSSLICFFLYANMGLCTGMPLTTLRLNCRLSGQAGCGEKQSTTISLPVHRGMTVYSRFCFLSTAILSSVVIVTFCVTRFSHLM